jgi:hypothetical protein
MRSKYRKLLIVTLLWVLTAAVAGAVPLAEISHTWGTAGEFTQNGYITLNTITSTWASPKAFPGVTDGSNPHTYFATSIDVGPWNYVYVVWTQGSGSLAAVAAYDNPYNPANQAEHYIGDAGFSSPLGGHAAFEAIAPVNGKIVIVIESAISNPTGTVNVTVLGFDAPDCAGHHVHGHISTTPPDGHDGDAHVHHAQHGHALPDSCPVSPPPTGCLFCIELSRENGERLDTRNLSALVSPFAAALNQNGTLNSTLLDPGGVMTRSLEAAPRGTVVQLFGSADGLFLDENHTQPARTFTPPVSGSPLYWTTSLPRVRIGGVPAQVLYSGLAPGLQGVWQINVLIPGDAPAGRVPVNISYEGDQINPLFINVK